MTDSNADTKQKKHRKKMQAQKERVDASIAAANIERGVAILLTGNGKGKSSSAFGMAMRALGYQQKVGIVQFIKGAQESGEVNFLRNNCPQVELHQMATGFTWNTQDRSADIKAAEISWTKAEEMLSNPALDLVVLDELTYMLAYKYLSADNIINAISNRPLEQSVIVTGRGGGRQLRTIMDTISEVKDIEHAYRNGIKARKGVDY